MSNEELGLLAADLHKLTGVCAKVNRHDIVLTPGNRNINDPFIRVGIAEWAGSLDVRIYHRPLADRLLKWADEAAGWEFNWTTYHVGEGRPSPHDFDFYRVPRHDVNLILLGGMWQAQTRRISQLGTAAILKEQSK